MLVKKFVGRASLEGVALCSVVPRATPHVRKTVRRFWDLNAFELTPKTLRGIGIDYPKPDTIGPDRLANAVAARKRFGAPVVVVDFGTAVTFDVVNRAGNYAGGIIAPGLAAMTDYLHEKTALLPRIKIREIRTEHWQKHGASDAGRRGAWLSRAGSGIDRRIEARIESETFAGGGDGRLREVDCVAQLPEISAVEPNLTLEGLRLVWRALEFKL